VLKDHPYLDNLGILISQTVKMAQFGHTGYRKLFLLHQLQKISFTVDANDLRFFS
jgi:hypothetical protein